MTLLEHLRPISLETFIGNRDAVIVAEAYMDGRSKTPAAIFMGQPGTGKTTLAHILAGKYGLEPIEINASAERNKKQKERILTQIRSNTVDGKQKLLIVDEAEGADPMLLQDLLDVRGRKIFIVNEPEELPWRFKRVCQHVVFELPTQDDYRTLLDRLGIEPAEEVFRKFKSFRDVINWIQGGDPESPVLMTDVEQCRAIFEGNKPDQITVPLIGKLAKVGGFKQWRHGLLDYYLYNGGDAEVASQLDMMSRRGGSKRAMKLVMHLRLHGLVNKPHQHFEKKTTVYKRPYLRVLGFRRS